MDKNFTKILFFLLFILLASTRSFSQTISLGTIDSGPYGQGSTIAVPISVNDATGCITPGNTYTLYLSDASGNFSPGTVIGTYSGFYTPFVNGVIPANTPAGIGYKVKVVSSTPAKASTASAAFTINAIAAPGVTASVYSSKALAPNSDIIIDCLGNQGTQFTIANTSTAGTTTTFSIFNETTQTATVASTPLTSAGYTFAADQANYTITVKTVNSNGTIVATRDYQLINNQTRTNLGSAGNGFVCLSGTGATGDLSYAIDISSGASGMQPNYPGDTYTFNWGDGSANTTFTYCQLKAANGVVTHTFTLPSCGFTANNKANRFPVVVTTISPYSNCQLNPQSNGAAQVLKQGTTAIVAPAVVCNGSPVIITNGSHPGPDPTNITTASCNDDHSTLYDWYLDDHTIPYASGVTLDQTLTIPVGLAAGSHDIWLHQRNAYCGGDEAHITICFEAPAQPTFTISQRVCQSATVAVPLTNTSIVDASCAASTATYKWTVVPPTGGTVAYKNGTSSTSQTPQFLFNTPGTYTVQLSITTTGCGKVSSPVVSVVVNAAPTVTLSAATSFCGKGQTLIFDNTTGSKTKTTFTGTTTATTGPPPTYLWTVNGGAYTFTDGTTANSQYPHINFTDDGIYTVSVTHTNECGFVTKSQQITFVEPPTVTAGTYPTICSTGVITLAGYVSTNNTGFAWSSSKTGGTFSPNANTLNATYTPAPSEVAQGFATLTLTGNPLSPCSAVTDVTTVTITPLVHVNSALTEGICSGTTTGYTITADQTNTTFSWTASATSGNPTGFTASGTGNSINDLLTNSTLGSSTAVDEQVTYKITPTYNGCPGPEVKLVVTVHPLPTITAAAVASPICTGDKANIKFTTNVANTTTYTWTTDVVAGVTGNVGQSTPIAATNGIQDVLVNTTATTQTITYHVTPHNGSCDGATVDVQVVVGPAIIADAGPNDEICNTTTTGTAVYTLHGNTPVVGTGTWDVVQGPAGAVFGNANDPNTTVSNLTLNSTYVFRWTVQAPAGCHNEGRVTIQVDLPTDPGNTSTGDPTTVCAGVGTGTIQLGTHTGAILGWEYSTNGITYNALPANTHDTQTFGPLTTDTWYRAIVQNGANCQTLRSGATHITVIQPPTTSVAGLPDRICGDGTYTLNGNIPTSGTGKWKVTPSAGITFDDDTKPNATASGLTAGTNGTDYVFTWTISTNSPCGPSATSVTISADPPAVAGSLTSSINTVCYNDPTQQTITLGGYQGHVVDWEYSTDNNHYNPVSVTPNTNTTQTFSSLTVPTWYHAIVKNGTSCPVVITQPILINVVTPPTVAVAGNEDRICGDGTYTLHGNTPTVGTGKWKVSPSTGITFDDDTKPDATASGLTAGAHGTDYVFTWTITHPAANGDNPCGDNSSSVTIHADPPAVPGSLGSPVTTVCYNDATQRTISLTGNNGNVVDWEYSTDNVHYNPVAATPNTNTTQTFSGLTVPTWYHAIVKNGTSCPAVITQPILINVVTPPTMAVAGNEDRICGDGTYTLHGNTPTVGTGKWKVSPSTGITFDDDTKPDATASGLTAGTNGTDYVFTWTITHPAANGDNPCGDNSSSVTIHDDAPPFPGSLSAPITTLCAGDVNQQTITLTGNQGSVVNWEYSTDNVHYNPVSATPNTNTTQTFVGLTISTWYRAIIQNGQQCGTAITQPILITILQKPSVSAPGPNDRICASTVYTLQGTPPAIGVGTWTVSPSAGVQFNDPNNPTATASGLVAGTTYVFTWTISNKGPNGEEPCSPEQNSVTIIDEVLPVAATSSDAIVCTGNNAGQIKVTGQFTSVDSWQYSTDNGTTWQPIGNTTTVNNYFNITQTTLYRAMVVIGPKCGPTPSSVTTITVVPPPTTANAGAADEVCGKTSYVLQGNAPGTGNTGKWTQVSGPTTVQFDNDANPNATVSLLTPGGTYEFKWTISATGSSCQPSTSTVKITDDLSPIGGTSHGDATVCAGGNIGQVTISGQSGTIDWQLSIDHGTTWTSTNNVGSTTQTYQNLTQETWYRAKLTNGLICDPDYSTVTKILVTQPPTTANAGPDDHVCGKTSYILQANAPGTGNTGKWTQVSGPTTAQFNDDTNPNATVSPLIPGSTYEFKWTISAAGTACTPSPSTVKIIDDLPPVGGTTSGDVTVCTSSNSGQINLTGQSGTIEWQMSTDGGNNWVSTNNPGSNVQTYRNLTQGTWYRAKLTNGLICDPDYSTISKVFVTQPPVIANAGTSLPICNQTTYTLQGNSPGTGTGKWTVTQGTGVTITPDTDPHGVASGLVPGNTYQFTWTITGYSPTSDHPCDPSSNTVTIIDDQLPQKGTISPDVTVCTGNNNGSISLTGQLGSIVWQSSTDGGNTWAPTGYTTNTQPYAGLTQTTKYRAMLTNGSCGPLPSDVATITVVQPPVTANAGISLPICNTDTYVLQGNSPGTGTGKWTVTQGTGVTILHDTDPNATATGLVAGNTYQFTWTITGYSPTGVHPCDPSSNTVTITDDLPPLPGIISPDVTVCTGNNNGSISLTGQLGSIVWMSSTDGGHTWTPTGYTTDTQPYAGLTQTTQYKAMLTHGSCPAIPSQIATITVVQPPVTANAGTSLSICNTDTYVLQGNSPGTGTGKWTVTQGTGVTILHDTDPNATATGLVPGNAYQFTWTITGYSPTGIFPCGPSSSTVTITDDLPPLPGTISADATVCTGSNNGQVSLTGQLGSIVWMSSTDGGHTWTPTGNTTDTQPYAGLTQTTQYKAMLTHGSCGPIPSDIATITVVQPPVTANAGQSLSICNAQTYTLQGNDPGTGTGKWTVAQGTGVTITPDNDPHGVASGLIPGNTYKFTWTITGSSPTGIFPCATSPSTVTIVDDIAPVGGTASADAIVCTGDNHGQLTLTGQFGTIQWVSSTDNGNTWIPTGFTNTVQPYTGLTQTTQYKAILTNGSCDPAYSNTVTITVGQPPALSNAGTDQAVCNVTTYTLQGSSPGTGTGKWTLEAGSAPATFDDATDPHTTARGLIAGNTYQFTWTTYGSNPDGTVSVCAPSATTVKITNDRLPVGGTTTGDATVCSGINSGTITLTGQFGTIQWVSSTDNGVTWVSTGNAGTTQPYSNLTQTTKYMAILSNGTCGTSNSTVTTITIGPAPIPSNPGTDDEVCSQNTYTLNAVLPVGATGKWTIESGAGAQFDDITDPKTIVRGLIPGNTYKFTWTVLGTSPCEPIPGTVTIKDDVPANGGVATAVPAIICAGSNSVITLAGQTGNILRWESSTDGTNWQPVYVTGTVQTFSNLTQTIQYRAISIGQGKCGEVPSAAAIVTVNPTTVVSNPGKDDEVCNVTTYTLNGNSPLPNTGLWTITGGPAGATLTDATNPKTTVTGLIPGNTYQFTWTITGTTPCAPSSNAVNIKIDLQAIGGTTAGSATVCSGGNDSLITLTGQFGTIVKWVSSTDNGSNWADVPNTSGATSYHYSGLTQTTQYKALLHQDGKCGDVYSTTTTITVNPQTVIANAGQNFNICNTSIAKLNGNNPAPFTGMWTQTAGPKVTFDDPTSYQAVVSGLTKGNVYTFKWTITGLAPCGNTDASVTVGAYEDVTPSFTQSQSQSCGLANVTFTNTSTPSPVGTFEWDFGDGTPIYTGVNPPTHSFAPSPNGNEITYTVKLTPVSNCGVQAPYLGTVKVSPAKPIASLLPGQISYCGTFSLTAKNMSPGNNAQYDFYMKDAKGAIVQHVRLNDTTTAVFQPITPTASTYYSVYLVATDFCGNQGTSSTINVSVAPSSIVSGIQIKGDLENICLGSPITFQNISTGGDRFTITVYDNAQKAILRMPSGTGDQNYTPTAIGTYYVSITAGNTGCGDAPASELKPFNVYPAPAPAFADNIDNNYNVSFFNNTPDVTGIPAPSLNYVWDFGDGSQKETTYTPKLHHFDASRSPFTVTLTATTPGTECFNVATKTIDIKFHGDLYVPNAFIPTSQNKELNTYRVKGTGMKTWHMQIFNNFGQLIWESTKLDANGSPTEGWDGTYKGQIVEQGVYIWQISATLLNGEEWKGMSYNGSTPSKTGPIHLIR